MVNYTESCKNGIMSVNINNPGENLKMKYDNGAQIPILDYDAEKGHLELYEDKMSACGLSKSDITGILEKIARSNTTDKESKDTAAKVLEIVVSLEKMAEKQEPIWTQ